MHYTISRNGQTYGPYTLDDLQRYLGTGNVLGADLVKSDDMTDWVPVSQLLAAQPAPTVTATTPPVSTVYTQPVYTSQALQPVMIDPALANSPYPDAPNLHWGLVVLFTVLTCGLFAVVWDIVIAVWLRRVQPKDQSLFWYLGSIGARVAKYVAGAFVAGSFLRNGANPTDFVSSQFLGGAAVTNVLSLVALGLMITANFIKRASLEEHFNGPEPAGLRLSGVMTFFFAPFYFQYHLNRIHALKQAARYGAPPVF